MLADDIQARLESQVPALAKRTQSALQLSEMLRQKALPNYTPAAFVVPNGLAFGAAAYETGFFVQGVEEAISIVLVVRTAADVRGAKAQAELQPLIWAVVEALAGWGPDEAGVIGVLVPRRGLLVRLDAGTVFYQLDFVLQQQVRITS